MAAIVATAGVARVPADAVRSRRRRRRLVAASTVSVVLAGTAVVAARETGTPAADRHELLLGVTDLTFSSTALEAEAGEITLAFANTDAVPHTFTIRELAVDVEAGGGQAARATFAAAPGTYDFVCTIPGHDTPGMRGVLTVTR